MYVASEYTAAIIAGLEKIRETYARVSVSVLILEVDFNRYLTFIESDAFNLRVPAVADV